MNSITKVFVGGMIAAVALVGAPLPQRAEAQAVRVDAESVTDAILNFRNLRATGVRVGVSADVAVDARRAELQEALRVLRVRGERYEEREPALRPAVLRERIKLGTLGERIKGARSVAELREIAGDLREHRRSDEVRNTIIGFYIDMLDTGLAMATHRSERILNALSDLARDGKDVSALKDLLAKADENIADARSMIRELHAAIDSGSYENLGEIKQDMKEAAGKLKEAYRIFSSIIVSAKAL